MLTSLLLAAALRQAVPPAPAVNLPQVWPTTQTVLYLYLPTEKVRLTYNPAGCWNGGDGQGRWWRWYNSGVGCLTCYFRAQSPPYFVDYWPTALSRGPTTTVRLRGALNPSLTAVVSDQ